MLGTRCYNAERMNLVAQLELITVPQEFTRLCNAVLMAEHGDDFLPIDDDRGDRGNDGYVKSQKRMFAAHCFKRVQNQSIDAAIKTKMVGDLGKAIALKNANIWDVEAWTFLSNYPVAEEIAASVVALGREAGIDVSWRGPEYFAAALERRPELKSVVPGLEVNEVGRQLAQLQQTVEDLHPSERPPAPDIQRTPESAEEREYLLDSRPAGWELLLFASLLRQGKLNLEPKWRDHELEIPARQRTYVESDEITHRISLAYGRLGSMVGPMERVFEAQEAAFGPPGEAGDPVLIEHFARWIINVYEDMLDWAAELRALDVPDEFERAVALTAKVADRPLSQVRAFIDRAVEQADRIPAHMAKSDDERGQLIVEATLAMQVDSDLMEEAVAELRRAIS